MSGLRSNAIDSYIPITFLRGRALSQVNDTMLEHKLARLRAKTRAFTDLAGGICSTLRITPSTQQPMQH